MTSRNPGALRKVSSDPPVYFARELSSTNETLKEAVSRGDLPTGSALLCSVQTKGRGRPGHRWHSERGDLMMSRWIIPDNRWSSVLPILSMAIAAACLETLDELGFDGIFWKFPNDLVARGEDERVGKLGGILLEPARNDRGEPAGWIAGIGINLCPKRIPSDPLEDSSSLLAISLDEISKSERRPFSPLSLGRLLSRKIDLLLTRSTPDEVRSDLERRLLWKGRWVAYTLTDGPSVGKVLGISPKGELLVEDPEGSLHRLGSTVRRIRPVMTAGGPA